MYLTTTLIVFCHYQPKTALKKARALGHHQVAYTRELPRYKILSDLVKGAKYILQKPIPGRAIMLPGLLKNYNGGMDFKNSILENAVVAWDRVAITACTRSSELLVKQSLDSGRREAQFFSLNKISDPFGNVLGENSHDHIWAKIMSWYRHKRQYLIIRLDTHKSDYAHKGCKIPVFWGTK